MYHGVIRSHRDVPPDRESGAHLYDLPLDLFEEQINWLKKSEMIVLTPDEVGSARRGIVLTFDDGEQNNHNVAMPVLKKAGFSGIFFVTSNRVDQPGYMTRQQVRHLAESGMTVGGHGLTHRVLTDLDDDQLSIEMVKSKQMLEDFTGMPIKSCSIPRGFYNQKVMDAAHQAGYEQVFVSDQVSNVPGGISRVAVKANWTLKRFVCACNGKIPMSEKTAHFFISGVKGFLGPQRYNQFRKILLGGLKP